MKRRVLGLAVAVAAAMPLAAQQRPQFRTATDLVTVDVSVRRGKLAATGLTAADFQLTDNGVAQTVEMLEMTALTLDVTVAVDTSGSMLAMIEPVRQHMASAASLLREGDRMRLISFSDTVNQVSGFQPVTPDFTAPPLVGGGLTSMYDGLVAALVPPREGDRRHLVVAFTDGFDTSSVVNSDALLEVGRHADSVLYLFLVKPIPKEEPPPPPPMWRLNTRHLWTPGVLDDGFFTLRNTAADTGGRFEAIFATYLMPEALKQAIDEFRTSYVLRYRATAVTPGGWHEVAVKLTKPGNFTVRARRGYFGS
jgi:hypothetical protein